MQTELSLSVCSRAFVCANVNKTACQLILMMDRIAYGVYLICLWIFMLCCFIIFLLSLFLPHLPLSLTHTSIHSFTCSPASFRRIAWDWIVDEERESTKAFYIKYHLFVAWNISVKSKLRYLLRVRKQICANALMWLRRYVCMWEREREQNSRVREYIGASERQSEYKRTLICVD